MEEELLLDFRSIEFNSRELSNMGLTLYITSCLMWHIFLKFVFKKIILLSIKILNFNFLFYL